MRQHAGVFAANFSSNLLWQNCFAPKKSAFCAEPRRAAAGILDVCQGGATMGLRETRLLRRMFSYARRPNGAVLFRLLRYRSVQPVDDVAFLHLSHIEEDVFAHLDVLTEGQIRHEQTATGALRSLDGEALRCGMLPQLVGGVRQTGKVQRPFQLCQLCRAVDIDQGIFVLEPVDTHDTSSLVVMEVV